MSQRTKITYLVLLVGLVVQPHIISGHVFGFSEAFAESIGTVVLLLMGYVAYYLHTRDVARKEQEVKKLESDLDVSTTRLNDSFKYTGLVNRKLSLIKKMTTDLLEKTPFNKKDKKNIFTELLSTATISVAAADWGMFRIIDTAKEITDKEFIMSSKQYALLKTEIGNKDLLACNGEKRKMYEVGDLYVFRSSDNQSEKQCFLIFPKPKKNLDDEVSLLQNITDQAQLFYKYLY